MDYIQSVEKKFIELFGKKPVLVCSPGRVNLIGEHTDYNLGFVLPAAIDKVIYFAISPRGDDSCNLFALDMNDSYTFTLGDVNPSEKRWANYLLGVVDQLLKINKAIKGFDCVFGGNIPIGAGLSSSAAIEAGLAFALNYIFDLNLDKLSLVKLAQKAENEFVGVKCGIMDQYINIFGKENKALKIDCRSLDYEYFPFNFGDVLIVLFDTQVSHSLASSEYNQRRVECDQGVAIIKENFPQVQSLRDVSIEMLSEVKMKMNEIVFKRCKYVIEENQRVIDACSALENGNLKQLGYLMFQTHEGLSKEYEVSCKELDFLVDLAKDNPFIYGSRMMGGGFGGCTINLIKKEKVDEIIRLVADAYQKEFNLKMKAYITKISGGTRIVSEKNYATIKL
ncbi:galactokinase [Melioribacteraceae bacterium 4301-Me]|uniref:galactokinase n=1 Tax=Pyranulibacter aquaticus TaxID=3163344 RepID=UPI00359A7E37